MLISYNRSCKQILNVEMIKVLFSNEKKKKLTKNKKINPFLKIIKTNSEKKKNNIFS